MKSEEKINHPKIGNVYFLKAYTAPKVFTGECFECTLTTQRVAKNARIHRDMGSLKDWIHEVYKSQRFAGLGVPQSSPQDRSEAESECGPAGTATPNSLEINVEALEKEGWEKIHEGLIPNNCTMAKRPILVSFVNGKLSCVWMGGDGEIFKGVKTMPDLRKLVELVG